MHKMNTAAYEKAFYACFCLLISVTYLLKSYVFFVMLRSSFITIPVLALQGVWAGIALVAAVKGKMLQPWAVQNAHTLKCYASQQVVEFPVHWLDAWTDYGFSSENSEQYERQQLWLQTLAVVDYSPPFWYTDEQLDQIFNDGGRWRMYRA